MATREDRTERDSKPRRSDLSRTGSAETRRTLVRSAAALWRTTGYADTSVADICRAAGVSKGLFYFYFARKEDVLAEMGVLSAEAARAEGRKLLDRQLPLPDVLRGVVTHLERSMRRNPPDLVLETIIEGYRRDASAPGESDPASLMFFDVFTRAIDNGELPATIDAVDLARLAQNTIIECARTWASGVLGRRAFDDEATRRLQILIDGFVANSGR